MFLLYDDYGNWKEIVDKNGLEETLFSERYKDLEKVIKMLREIK